MMDDKKVSISLGNSGNNHKLGHTSLKENTTVIDAIDELVASDNKFLSRSDFFRFWSRIGLLVETGVLHLDESVIKAMEETVTGYYR